MSVRVNDPSGTVHNGIKVETPYEDADKGVKVDDFLKLMVAQLANQDFMNPVDDTQYMSQMAQFATMKSMQDLTHFSQINYVTGLVGKSVTVANLGIGGAVKKDTGVVSGVNISGGKYTVTVNGKQYELSQIMSIDDKDYAVAKDKLSEANKKALVIKDAKANQVSLRWDPPVEDDELTYSVYYTKDPDHDMSTLSSVKQANAAVVDQKNRDATISGLEPGTIYFVNVVVKNKNGDEAIYQTTTTTTASS